MNIRTRETLAALAQGEQTESRELARALAQAIGPERPQAFGRCGTAIPGVFFRAPWTEWDEEGEPHLMLEVVRDRENPYGGTVDAGSLPLYALHGLACAMAEAARTTQDGGDDGNDGRMAALRRTLDERKAARKKDEGKTSFLMTVSTGLAGRLAALAERLHTDRTKLLDAMMRETLAACEEKDNSKNIKQ